MRTIFCFATLATMALAAHGYTQESKARTTKAMYMITGLHCAPCATTVEKSLKKVKGVAGIKVDFQGKYATVEFEEKVISAQEVARALADTPHMMGPEMHYGGALVLSVPGTKDKAAAAKAEAALRKVDGIAKVTLFPQQETVAIEFANKGKVTSVQLLEALASAGLKGTQHARGTTDPVGPEMNGMNDSMANHASMVAVSRACGCCGCCR